MEWTNIEKKWHEMARRLQNAAGKDKVGTTAEGARTGSAFPDATRTDEPDTRALA